MTRAADSGIDFVVAADTMLAALKGNEAPAEKPARLAFTG